MKKVLFISHSAELNGAELMLLETLSHLDKSWISPVLVVPAPGRLADEARARNLETREIPMKWWLTEPGRQWKQPLAWTWNLSAVLRLNRIINREGIRLVVSNSAATFSGALAAFSRRRPHIWIIHELLAKPHSHLAFLFGRKALIRLIYGLSTCVVVNSRATREAFPDPAGVELVYNGVSVHPAAPGVRSELRRQFGFGPRDFVLGIVGKISEPKGQREVIAAVEKLKKSFPEVRLLVVGAVRDETYYLGLLQHLKQHGLDQEVVFTGYRRDVRELLQAMDLLVATSRFDSFGRSIIEAMAAGTPVLALRAGGAEEIIRHGDNGFLSDSREPEALSRDIAGILKQPELRRRFAEAGIRTVREKFSLDDQVSRIQGIMEKYID